MRFYRYMSAEEFSLLTAGVTISGKSRFHARTSSTGICFLGEKTEFSSYDQTYTFDPVDCMMFLFGIVNRDVLVEFEAVEEPTPSYGVYADPFGYYDDTIIIQEYCLPSYNRDTMRPLRYLPDITSSMEFTPVVWYPIHLS